MIHEKINDFIIILIRLKTMKKEQYIIGILILSIIDMK